MISRISFVCNRFQFIFFGTTLSLVRRTEPHPFWFSRTNRLICSLWKIAFWWQRKLYIKFFCCFCFDFMFLWNILQMGMITLYWKVWTLKDWIVSQLFFYKDDFDIELTTKVDMPLNRVVHTDVNSISMQKKLGYNFLQLELEIESAIRVQIWGKAVCVSHRAFGKRMNQYFLPPVMIKLTGFFSLGWATNPGKGKTLNPNQQ